MPGVRTDREETNKRFDEVNKILRRLREDLRIAIIQKELELEMREKQLIQLKKETLQHYNEFLGQTNKLFSKFEKRRQNIIEKGLNIGVQYDQEYVQEIASPVEMHNMNQGHTKSLLEIQKKSVEQIDE